MKTNQDKYVKEVINGFQANRGRASVYCFHPIDFADLIIKLIDQFYIKSHGVKVFIVVDSFKTRTAIINALASKPNAGYNTTILSADYVKTSYLYDYKLIIAVGLNDNLDLINFLSRQGKFILSIFTKNIMDSNYITSVRSILPNIHVTVSNNSVRTDNIYSPVEERRIAISLSAEDHELYEKYNEYIATSVSIFGDISIIDKCKYGDSKLNISAVQFREEIAANNGWSSELNTSIEWNKKIDDIYNPNNLFERANNFFTITKQRRDLVTDNEAKLHSILAICTFHSTMQILIVSKRGEFASKVTKYLNEFTDLKCADYHDNIESSILIDSATNEPVLVKSGASKGQPKIVGAQSISTMNLTAFNSKQVNVLSIKSSSNVKLKTAIDLVIFTSPFVDDIIAFKTRFTDVTFNSVPTINYKVYCRGTIENKHLSNQKESSLIKVIPDDEDEIDYNNDNDAVVL